MSRRRRAAFLALTIGALFSGACGASSVNSVDPEDKTNTSLTVTTATTDAGVMRGSALDGSHRRTNLMNIAEKADAVVVATLGEVTEAADTPPQLAGEMQLVRVYFPLEVVEQVKGTEVPDGTLLYAAMRSIRDGIATTNGPEAALAAGDKVIVALGPAEPDGSRELLSADAIFFVDEGKAALLAALRLRSSDPQIQMLGDETKGLSPAAIIERLRGS